MGRREGDVLMSDDRSIAVQTMTSLTGVNVIQVCFKTELRLYMTGANS